MTLADKLCKLALCFFPAEFRAAHGEEILTAFHARYNSRRRRGLASLMWHLHQLADLGKLAAVGAGKRISMMIGRPDKSAITDTYRHTKEIVDTGIHRVIWRVFYSGQAAKETRWLTEMSMAGWHFVDYKPYWYWFRRLEQPLPLEYCFERRHFWWWHAQEEEAYLDKKAEDGWEYFKFYAGWYYFRRTC